ncbi:hypothetical protein ACA910_002767 [Epithemia clementina (nom. ined.)]
MSSRPTFYSNHRRRNHHYFYCSSASRLEFLVGRRGGTPSIQSSSSLPATTSLSSQEEQDHSKISTNENNEQPEYLQQPEINNNNNDASKNTLLLSSSLCWQPQSPPPYLALITEPNCCDSDEALEHTVWAIQNATYGGHVDLVSIRVLDSDCPKMPDRLHRLTQRMVELSHHPDHDFAVVRSSSLVVAEPDDDDCTTAAAVGTGVHVKELHQPRIPEIRQKLLRAARVPEMSSSSSPSQSSSSVLLLGTSAHCVESAVQAWNKYQPDYFFVGTCYPTLSHPDKTEMEGPALPGQVVQALQNAAATRRTTTTTNDHEPRVATSLLAAPPLLPIVFAIGGIHRDNCAEPVRLGAQGVAVIRAVLQAPNPNAVVREMKQTMIKSQ